MELREPRGRGHTLQPRVGPRPPEVPVVAWRPLGSSLSAKIAYGKPRAWAWAAQFRACCSRVRVAEVP